MSTKIELYIGVRRNETSPPWPDINTIAHSSMTCRMLVADEDKKNPELAKAAPCIEILKLTGETEI